MPLEFGTEVPTAPSPTVGPRGGDLTAATHPREWRTASLKDQATGLHRFEGEFKETTVVPVKNEQAWHLMAAYMIVAKRTNSEVAMAAGVDVNTISRLKAQRWFQERLAQIANEEGEEVVGVLKGEALASVMKLVELRDHAESERVQLTAATTLVEHANGKPTQKVISHSVRHNLDPKEEYDELMRDLEALKKQAPSLCQP